MSWRLLIILTLFAARAWTQCPPPADVMSKIADVEGSAVANTKKITLLRSLADQHEKCVSGKDSVYARAMHRIGDLYRLDGDFNSAFAYTYEAIAINRSGREAAQPSYLTNSYYNLGIYYNLQSQFNASVRCFDSSIHYGVNYSDKHIIALMAYEQKSFLYFQRGDYQESIAVSDEGINFARRDGDEFYEAVLLTQKAQSQWKLGDLVSAEQNIKYGIAKIGNDAAEYLATAYAVYAAILKEKKDYYSSIEYYNRSYAINKKAANWPQCSRDLMDLGYLYDHYLTDTEKALQQYHKAIKYAIISNDKYLQAALYTNMGVVHWRGRDYRQALSHYQHALNILPMDFKNNDWQTNPSFEQLQAITNDYYLATLLFNKAETLLDLSRTENNKTYLDGSLNTFLLADKVMTKMRWQQLYDESKLFWRKETKQMYEKAIEACYLAQNTDRAFYFFEKSRAVLLKDKLLKLNYDSVISLSVAQEKLNTNNQSLVEYFTGDSVLYMLAIGRNTTFVKSPIKETRQQAAALITICSNPTTNNLRFAEYKKLSLSLYETLLEPLDVKSERIVISPDEEFIPFEVLMTHDGYLLEKYSVSYTYSADLLFRDRVSHGDGGSFLGIAPVMYKDQPSLIGSDKSLTDISKYFPRPNLFVNGQATRATFFQQMPSHNIVQLYTHGYAEGQDPLLYFNDSAVRLSEIQQLKNIQTQMITLSACQTGIGKMATGEGVFSFARGFYAAGIPSLLTTLWQVDDRATYHLTELFYKHLQQGLNKDEALRQAKLEFIAASDKQYQLPYYWSSYILIGDAGWVASEEKEWMLPVILVVSAVLLATIFFFGRKKLRS